MLYDDLREKIDLLLPEGTHVLEPAESVSYKLWNGERFLEQLSEMLLNFIKTFNQKKYLIK